MDAVVLAAGKGTRLRPLTDDVPKGMVVVDGRPILSHCFDRLVDLGADKIVVVIGYRWKKIVEHYGFKYRGVPIEYARQEQQKGLADALLAADMHVKGCFMLMLGDNLFDADLAPVVERQLTGEVDVSLAVAEVDESEASRYGVVVEGIDGQVERVVEKPEDPPSTLAGVGFCVLPCQIFDACRRVEPSDRGEYELTDAINLLIDGGAVAEATEIGGWWIDVGFPEDRDEAERYLASVADTA